MRVFSAWQSFSNRPDFALLARRLPHQNEHENLRNDKALTCKRHAGVWKRFTSAWPTKILFCRNWSLAVLRIDAASIQLDLRIQAFAILHPKAWHMRDLSTPHVNGMSYDRAYCGGKYGGLLLLIPRSKAGH